MFNYVICKNTAIMNKPALSYFRGDFFFFDKKDAAVYPNLRELDAEVAKLQKQYPNDNVRVELLK